MNRTAGTLAISLGVVAFLVASLAYPIVGGIGIAVAAFYGLWGLVDCMFGHHFERDGR